MTLEVFKEDLLKIANF